MKNLRVAAIQFEHADGDKDANLGKVRAFVKQAQAQGVEMIVFPECCLTGYWFLRKLARAEIEALAEPAFNGPSSQALAALAREHGMTIGAGLVERADDGRLYNTYVVASPDGSLHRHRKLHAFISEHMSSGDEYTVFDTALGWRVGVLICYDNNIGENVRMNGLQGVDVLLAPHQTGGCASPNPHLMGAVPRELWDRRREDRRSIEREFHSSKGRGWMLRWLPARAHDNGLFLIFSNGVGVDDDEVRTGNAMVLDPYGRILAETWAADDDMVVADLEAGMLTRNTGRRWITTRRPELYAPLARPTGREKDTRTVRFDPKGGT